MRTKNISLILSIILLSAMLLTGCGASNPGSGGTTAAQPGSGGGSLALTVMFPAQTATAPAALISPNTTAFAVTIWDLTFTSRLGYAYITKPAGGGQVTTSIILNNYTGWANVDVVGYNQNGTPNSWMTNLVNITGTQNQPLSVAVVEMKQGVVIPAGTPGNILISPDGVTYTINNLYLDLDPTRATFFQYNYMLGANVTAATPQGVTNGYFQSVHNIASSSKTYLTWFGLQWDGYGDFHIEVPNASRTVWNRYYFSFDFNNGPAATPTNTPTIQSVFQGTLTFNASGAVVPAVGVYNTPGASGTVVLNMPNAAWANNVAPTSAQLGGAVTFYTQAPPPLNQIIAAKHQAFKPNSIKVGR